MPRTFNGTEHLLGQLAEALGREAGERAAGEGAAGMCWAINFVHLHVLSVPQQIRSRCGGCRGAGCMAPLLLLQLRLLLLGECAKVHAYCTMTHGA